MTPTPDATIAAVTCLRDTLLAIPEVEALVGENIFWEDVEDTQEFPYILISHILGGYENNTQTDAVDVTYKVCGYSADKLDGTVQALQEAIAQLHYADMVVSDFTNVEPYSTIRMWIPVYERENRQNVPVYAVGGIFRLRFIIHPETP